MIPASELGESLRTAVREGTISSDPQDIAASQLFNHVIDPGLKPSHIVRPAKVEELQELLRLANASGLNLTVASSAGRHSRGGFAAPKDHILIDLSTWQKIPWINRRNRVCLIEPGVTYGPSRSGWPMTCCCMPSPPRRGVRCASGCWPRR